MDPVLRAVLLSWDWRVDVLFVLALAGTLYTTGWWRLRRRTWLRRQEKRTTPGWTYMAARWRLVSHWLGLLVIGIALMSPIDVLSGQLFFVHMIQHLLLIMIAPPLLLLPNPMATMLWGLPTPLRYRVGDLIGRLLHRQSRVRHGLRAVTKPGFIWMFAVIAILGWHDPNAYNAALRDDFIHDLEHLCFFAAGMFSFWHITGAGPRIHKRSGLIGRIAFAIAAVPPNMLTGVVIAFATTPIYSHYTTVPRLWGISVLTDQQLAGIIMWIPGSMMYFMIALVLIARLLQGEARKPALPQAAWATDETLLASGLEQ